MEISLLLSNKQLAELSAGNFLTVAVPSPMIDACDTQDVTVNFDSLPLSVVILEQAGTTLLTDAPGDGSGLVRLLGRLVQEDAPLVKSKIRSKIYVALYVLYDRNAAKLEQQPPYLGKLPQWPADLRFDGKSIVDTYRAKPIFT